MSLKCNRELVDQLNEVRGVSTEKDKNKNKTWERERRGGGGGMQAGWHKVMSLPLLQREACGIGWSVFPLHSPETDSAV